MKQHTIWLVAFLVTGLAACDPDSTDDVEAREPLRLGVQASGGSATAS